MLPRAAKHTSLCMHTRIGSSGNFLAPLQLVLQLGSLSAMANITSNIQHVLLPHKHTSITHFVRTRTHLKQMCAQLVYCFVNGNLIQSLQSIIQLYIYWACCAHTSSCTQLILQISFQFHTRAGRSISDLKTLHVVILGYGLQSHSDQAVPVHIHILGCLFWWQISQSKRCWRYCTVHFRCLQTVLSQDR